MKIRWNRRQLDSWPQEEDFIGITPWETYIAYSTNPCIVGRGKTMGVILNPDFLNLYQCGHTLDLKDGR